MRFVILALPRDFAEMDRIIKDQHLSLALQRAPHMRTAHDLDLVTKFVQTSWQRASELGTKTIQVPGAGAGWDCAKSKEKEGVLGGNGKAWLAHHRGGR